MALATASNAVVRPVAYARRAYLDEFVFRFNRRHNPEAAFRKLLGLGSVQAPVSRTTIEGVLGLPYYFEADEVEEEVLGA